MDAAAAAEEEEGKEDRLWWALDVERRKEVAVWSAEVERGIGLRLRHRAAVAEAQVGLAEGEVDVVTAERDWAVEVNERNYHASERRVARLMALWNENAASDLRLRNVASQIAAAEEVRAEAAEVRAEAAEGRAAEAERRAEAAESSERRAQAALWQAAAARAAAAAAAEAAESSERRAAAVIVVED